MSAEIPLTAGARAREAPELILLGELPKTGTAIRGYIEQGVLARPDGESLESPLKVKRLFGDVGEWVQAAIARQNLKNEKIATEAWQMVPPKTQEETINFLQQLGLDASRMKPRELVIAFKSMQEKRLKTLKAALTLERQPERELTLRANWESTAARVKKIRHWVSDKVSTVLAPVGGAIDGISRGFASEPWVGFPLGASMTAAGFVIAYRVGEAVVSLSQGAGQITKEAVILTGAVIIMATGAKTIRESWHNQRNA